MIKQVQREQVKENVHSNNRRSEELTTLLLLLYRAIIYNLGLQYNIIIIQIMIIIIITTS